MRGGSMVRRVVVVVTKSPQEDGGRIGPMKWQDWYRQATEAALLAKEDKATLIVVVSALKIGDCPDECSLYERELLAHGAPPDQISLVRDAYETIGQLEVYKELLATIYKDASVIVLSTFLHAPRVEYLWRRLGLPSYEAHIRVWGVPRPSEACKDFVGTFLIRIPWLWKRIEEKVRRRTIERRQRGEF